MKIVLLSVKMEPQPQPEPDFSLSDEHAGQCTIRAKQLHLTFPVRKYMLVYLAFFDERGFMLGLNKYHDCNQPMTYARHTVLLHRPTLDQNRWRIIDPTYVVGYDPSKQMPPIPYVQYVRELTKLYHGYPHKIEIRWTADEGNFWLGMSGCFYKEIP